jgi:hypothetical protein
MSRITLSGNASGTGNFTLASPNSNTDRTLTLPDATGTVLTDQSTVSATQIAGALNASGSAPIYACRAWVNFNGTGTPTIRAAGNVSSITDNGTGDYTLNFTTALEDANYAPVSMGRRDAATQDSVISIHLGTLPTTTALRIGCTNGNGTFEDFGFVCVAVFR